MNARTVRLKKEVRALFWPWCAVMIAGALPLPPAVAALLAPAARNTNWTELIGFLGFFIGIPLLATLSFGHEFQHRTLSLLLSQPVSRMTIWSEKLGVTMVAVLSAALAFYYGWRSGFQQERALLVIAGLYVRAPMASAAFWTLFARSTMGGIALNGCALYIFPGSFVIGVAILRQPGANWDEILGRAMTSLGTAAFAGLFYAGVMLWLGARKLARFQVTGGMAGDDLLMSGPSVMPEALAGWFRCRPTGPFLNLIRKELCLLRPLWLIALLVVLYLAGLTMFGLLPQPGSRPSAGQMALFTPVVGLIPVIAILAGCLSLGEERTSGTHSWHMTLPVSARRQWLIKLAMAVFTGFVCAALFPMLVLIAGGFLFGSPYKFVDPSATDWLLTMLLLSLASFWCACAVNGTLRAAMWLFPVLGALSFASRWGEWMGQELARTTGTLTDFVVSWFQLSPLALTGIQFTGPTFFWLLVPVLLLAVVQSYRLFRTQPQEGVPWMMRCLLPLVVAAFLCGFSVSAGWAATRWEPLYETVEAIEKLHAGGAAAQLTVEDLAKVSPLSALTRRWLRDSGISVVPDQAHSGYFATIHLASGLDCRLTVGHYGGRSFGRKQPSCAQKGP